METPTGLAIKSLPVCTTNRHNDPRHSDTAPVETGTEQTLVRVARGRGLEHSPLARLPPELRTKIFEMAFIHPTGISLRACEVWNRPDDDELESAELEHGPPNPRGSMIKSICAKTSWALKLMATCQQIQSEIKNRLLSLNDINVHGVDFHQVEVQQPGILHIIPLIRNISSILGIATSRVVLWQYWNGQSFAYHERDRHLNLPPPGRINGLEVSLSRYARAIQPLQLFIGLSMNYHALVIFNNVPVCERDAPVTLGDCRRIHCIIPLGDRTRAMKMVDDAIDGRLALLRRHSTHQLCNVRAMRRKLESGLEFARQYMREEVNLIF
jgi:hypothetical protein